MGFARFAKRKNASFDSKSSTHFEPSDRKKGGKTFSLDPGEMQGKTFSTSGRAEFIVKNAKEIMIPTRHSHRSQTLTEHRTKKNNSFLSAGFSLHSDENLFSQLREPFPPNTVN